MTSQGKFTRPDAYGTSAPEHPAVASCRPLRGIKRRGAHPDAPNLSSAHTRHISPRARNGSGAVSELNLPHIPSTKSLALLFETLLEHALTLKTVFAGGLAAIVPQMRQQAGPIQTIGNKAPVQVHPVVLKDRSGHEYRVFVDAVAREQSKIIVLGWMTCRACDLRLSLNGQDIPVKVERHARGDVAEALNLPSGEALGFSLVCDAPAGSGTLELRVNVPQADPFLTGPLAEMSSLTRPQRALVPELLYDTLDKLRGCPVGSMDWWAAVGALPDADMPPPGVTGVIDNVLISSTGSGVIVGWALHPADAVIWLEDEMRNVYPLQNTFRCAREDITKVFRHLLWGAMDAGFIAFAPALNRHPTIRLRAATRTGVTTISERSGAEPLPADPRAAAEKLFAIGTSQSLFHRRAAQIDWPVLEPIIREYHAEVNDLETDVKIFGDLPESPAVSVIVPLYKRFDFMEHQILEFMRDPYFHDKVELVYVIDDPKIAAATLAESNTLFQLYDFPFKIVYGLRNRGFSGANNLGAQNARAKSLLFLNSDVIPKAPGWLEKMVDTLEDPAVGAVGAQLLFADGGIQHIGIDFEYLPDFSIWSNQHPQSGMPETHPGTTAIEAPAVTGACVLVRAELFSKINGWDIGYLLGDFEDSHLCFAIRNEGYRILCQHQAVLTHLERQSFASIGNDEFRIRTTICNAVRHQTIWRSFLQPNTTESDIAGTVKEGVDP